MTLSPLFDFVCSLHQQKLLVNTFSEHPFGELRVITAAVMGLIYEFL